MSENIENKLTACFQAVFPDIPVASLNSASADTIPEWDSIAMVTLMNVVEEEFSISVPPEDLEHWTSFQAVRQYLERANGNS